MENVYLFIILALIILGPIWLLLKLWNLPDYMEQRKLKRLKKAMIEAGVAEDSIFIHENTLFTVKK